MQLGVLDFRLEDGFTPQTARREAVRMPDRKGGFLPLYEPDAAFIPLVPLPSDCFGWHSVDGKFSDLRGAT